MNVRGRVLDVGNRRTVTTDHGDRSVGSVVIDVDGDPMEASLWGSWADSVEHLSSGMELSLRSMTRSGDELQTSRDSFVVIEPNYIVDVTAIRSWAQCPRLYYLNKLTGVPLKTPVVKGTVIHEVFGDLLRGRDSEEAIDDRIRDAGLEIGLLGEDLESLSDRLRPHVKAIEGWLAQGTLDDEDGWRSEMTLLSPTFGIKGRADAVRRGMPVELKTGKNTDREPRFPDKVQVACYALMLGDREQSDAETRDAFPNTGTLLYTNNATLDRSEASGHLSPAKEFSIRSGLLEYVVRARNHLVAMELTGEVPSGYEADPVCEYCFEQDTCLVISGKLDQQSKAGAIGSPLPESERAAFERMYSDIEAERRAIHAEFAKLWQQSAEERAADDRALIDLEPTGRTPISGGQWELQATPTGPTGTKLREGDLALASDGDPIHGRSELARIERLDEQIVVTTPEPLQLRRLDVYPSDIGTNTSIVAMHDAILRGDSRRKAILFGDTSPTFTDTANTYIKNNDSQNDALNLALNARDFALIQGPPGTGKTYTIARLVQAAVERGERVLISAYTNRAVDNVLDALLEDGFSNFLRIGTESGVRSDLHRYRLPRSGDPASLAERLSTATVVAATTTSCGSRAMRSQSFDLGIVDEAAQLTEPDTYAAINLTDRFVLVGDHKQLPPIVRSPTALTRSLFEQLIDAHPEASVMLTKQYRMAQGIQAFSSTEFYEGALRPATHEVASQRPSDLTAESDSTLPQELDARVRFIDVPSDATGHRDIREAEIISEQIDSYLSAGISPTQIGVIAPYRAQVATIADRVPDEVTVDTVDRFQGSSKEIMFVSFVVSDAISGPIFEDYRRLNVALTRAKKGLVLVGTQSAIETDPVYSRMLEWANRSN